MYMQALALLQPAGLAEDMHACVCTCRRWLSSNLLGWQKSGVMHEKYDATRPGERGGGGEYTPQVGFGWTNGVVLWMLETLVARGGRAEHLAAELGEVAAAAAAVDAE